MREVLFDIIVAVLTIIVIGVLVALPVMLTWNLVMPDVFGLSEINFWQALFLSLLAKFLFGGRSSKED